MKRLINQFQFIILSSIALEHISIVISWCFLAPENVRKNEKIGEKQRKTMFWRIVQYRTVLLLFSRSN